MNGQGLHHVIETERRLRRANRAWPDRHPWLFAILAGAFLVAGMCAESLGDLVLSLFQ
jgi:hypothetical protein